MPDGVQIPFRWRIISIPGGMRGLSAVGTLPPLQSSVSSYERIPAVLKRHLALADELNNAVSRCRVVFLDLNAVTLLRVSLATTFTNEVLHCARVS